MVYFHLDVPLDVSKVKLTSFSSTLVLHALSIKISATIKHLSTLKAHDSSFLLLTLLI